MSDDTTQTAAELHAMANGAAAAEAFQAGEVELNYGRAGKVALPPVPESEPMVTRGLRNGTWPGVGCGGAAGRGDPAAGGKPAVGLAGR